MCCLILPGNINQKCGLNCSNGIKDHYKGKRNLQLSQISITTWRIVMKEIVVPLRGENRCKELENFIEMSGTKRFCNRHYTLGVKVNETGSRHF